MPVQWRTLEANLDREDSDGGVLFKMQGKKRNERCQGYNHEKRQTGDPGSVSGLWHKDVQNRQRLRSFGLLPKRKVEYANKDHPTFRLSEEWESFWSLGI